MKKGLERLLDYRKSLRDMEKSMNIHEKNDKKQIEISMKNTEKH